jgi:ABC-type bacteriocin/lantibiotic exporter with double-glycine peptidase domain
MVLAHYGASRTEAELRLLLDTQPTGTRAGNLMRLSEPAFEVYLHSSNLVELHRVLADQQPPIVFLKTGSLEYWGMDIFHTAVLVGLNTASAALNDPYFSAAAQVASLQNFEKAWAQSGHLTAFIRPRKQPCG